ncbi:MAG: PepSY1/2 domain-containing protein [Acutalibacteraceae bacterium]
MTTSKTKKLRCLVRIITYVTAVIIVLTILLVLHWRMSSAYSRRLQYDYEQQMYSLSDYLGEIDRGFQLSAYITTPTQFSRVAASIWNNCGSAKACVSALPTSFVELDNTYRFLSQAGEYIQSLSRTLSSGGSLSDNDRATLKSYSEYASSLSAEIAEIRDEMETSGGWSDMVYKAAFSDADDLSEEYLYTSLADSETALSEIPDPIYSGPYSSHITSRESEMLNSMNEISEEEAKSTAAKMLGTDEANLVSSGTSTENDKFSSYRFSTSNGDYAAVSIRGGLPVYFMKNISAGSTIINEREALSAGLRYLNEIGLNSFKATYYSIADSIMTVEYSYVVGDVTCLTDVIKLNIALDTGDIISFDARQYLLNNHERSFSQPKNYVDAALMVLSPNLTMTSYSLAVVPLNNVSETLCYEFICKADSNTNVIVFINCDTLEEEDIKIVGEGNSGVYLT